jgi:hypothetical protein
MRGKDPRPIVVMVLVLVALLGPALAPAAQTKVQPSSHITAIDHRSGVASAKVNATGENFQFTLNDPTLLGTLKIGQGVYANFQTKQVSLDGQHIVGNIVNIKAPNGPLTPATPGNMRSGPSVPSGASPKNTPNAAPSAETSGSSANTACCGIISVDARARRAAAKENSTGRQFEFSVPSGLQIQNLHASQPVWANFKAGKVSLDGRTACCDIVALGNIPPGPTGQPVAESAPVGPGKPGGTRPQMAAYREIDPCTISSPDTLKTLLQGGIQNYFPIAIDNGGEHMRIAHPNVEQVICPHMVLKVRTDFGYSQTQGFPQFQTGGTMELQSSLVVDVTFSGGAVAAANAPITAANFVRAAAVLSNPQITSLQVDNIPSWIDLSWITACLNGAYSNWCCTDVLHAMNFDVTALVKFYLDQGQTLAASSPSMVTPSQPQTATPADRPAGSTIPAPGSGQAPRSAVAENAQRSPGTPIIGRTKTVAPATPLGIAPLICSAFAPLGSPQLAANQKMELCFQVTPQPVAGGVARIQDSSTISMNAVVTGIPPGNQSLQYKFSVLSLAGDGSSNKVTDSGDFSASTHWNWQIPAQAFLSRTLVAQVSVQGSTPLGPVQKTATTGNYLVVDDAGAASIFLDQMGVVMLHPRCSNCHANGDVPTQGDDRHLHVPPVTRQTNCQQCHGTANGAGLGSPPGAPGWRMAPFAFAGKTADQLCAQLKDPARNGGRTPQGLADSLFNPGQQTFDPLASWAFNPGPGRTPAPGGDLIRGIWSSFESWIKYGAACPSARMATQQKGLTEVVANVQNHLISQMGCSTLPAMTWVSQGESWAGATLSTDCQGNGGQSFSYLTQLLAVGVNLASPAPDTGQDITLTLSPPEMGVGWTPASLHFEPRTSSAIASYWVQPVAKATAVTVTARDPVSGTQYSTTLHILAPQPVGLKFLDTNGQEVTAISAVPSSGTAIKLKTYYTAPAPDSGMSVNFSYGGTTNASGPCGLNPASPCSTNVQTQISDGDKPTAFISLIDLTVSPCANAPCQIVVSAGSQTATLTVNQ